MKFVKLLLPAVALMSAFSIYSSAQQDDDTIRVETNLVTLNIAVTDRNGNYVRGLQKKDFQVLDDNFPKVIDEFSAEEAPVVFGIVYDMHPTTSERSANVLESLRKFTKELKPKDNFFVTIFNERGSLTTDFVPTNEQLQTNLTDLKPSTPNSLYDAIFAASGKIRERKNAKQVLLVLTDGEDHSSHHSLKELRLHLRSVNLPIYTISFHDENKRQWGYSDIYRNQNRQTLGLTETNELNEAVLAELSKTSGGQIFQREIQSRLFIYAICKKIQAEVENQYVLGFYADGFDGKWHKLKVRVGGGKAGKLRLSNRRGYQSPSKKSKG
ncbi:MAG TPA: VWA domain-containing protein [Pyrinomonadaceae bacterium]|jgi:Ca-activated chloride channel family protein